MTTRLDELAQQVLREGYVNNEVDARLAAIRIILAAERLSPSTTNPYR